MTINKPILYYPSSLFLLFAFISKSDDPKGLSVGAIAPKFDATDQFGKQYDLEEQLKKGPVVLMFYRGHWCKYCNRQLEQLSDSLEFIHEKGAPVVTVTRKPWNLLMKHHKSSTVLFELFLIRI